MYRVPFFPTPGNHECITGRAAPYLSVHSLPDSGTPAEDKGRYYSYDWGDVHFVSLDSNLLTDAAVDRMHAWFDKDLKATAKPWKIVYFHHTPYPSGFHLEDPVCALARDRINPVAERNGVHLVLNGHEHSFQRTLPLSGGNPVMPGFGTTYINTSGGGGALQDIGLLPVTAVGLHVYNYLRADVEGRRITIRAIRLDGAEVDRVVITPGPAVRHPPRFN